MASANKKEQELLTDIHCVLFRGLCDIIDDTLSSQKLAKKELLARLGVGYGQDPSEEEALIKEVFPFSKGGYESGYARLVFRDMPAPTPTTTTELVWLKTMLLDPQASYLLSDELREKLLARLDSVAALPADTWEMVQRAGDDIAAITPALSTIWRALNGHYQLRLAYTGRTGKQHSGTLEPLRLEYDITGNRYYLIAYSRKRCRAIKARVSAITSIEALPKLNGADVEELYSEFLEDKKQKLILRILARKDNFNVSDRAFTLLAPYDHGGSYDEENGEYRLEISYYDFDREDLLRRILSLGANAIVESPADMRDEIIARLKARLAAYQNDTVGKGRWAASLIHP